MTNLDQPLFDGSGVPKRALIEYLDAVHAHLLPELEQRPLSVIRVHRGQEAFMQKNLPASAPDWVPTVELRAESTKRTVRYALCNDRRTLRWFGNQRAVEYHPTLVRIEAPEHPTHLVVDLDPPSAGAFRRAVDAARLVRDVLAACKLAGAVKTSGAKGLHVVVPVAGDCTVEDAAAATRAIAARGERLDPALTTTAFLKDDRGDRVFLDATRVGGATVIAAYSPRVRAGVPVSTPVAWDELDEVEPAELTIRTVPERLAAHDPWRVELPEPQALPEDLVAEGHTIPAPRVRAMHEGRRRARERRRRGDD